MTGDYKRSKFQAEQVALEFARSGFPVVVVNPSAPIGDHDVKPTPHRQNRGRFPEWRYARLHRHRPERGGRPRYCRGPLACQRGKVGERYILGSENLTLAQILEKLARIAHRKAPTIRLPYAVAYCAGACSTAWANLTGKPPRVPLSGVRMARKRMWVTHEKARRELGFTPGPADQALKRAVEWFGGPGRPPRVA